MVPRNNRYPVPAQLPCGKNGDPIIHGLKLGTNNGTIDDIEISRNLYRYEVTSSFRSRNLVSFTNRSRTGQVRGRKKKRGQSYADGSERPLSPEFRKGFTACAVKD